MKRHNLVRKDNPKCDTIGSFEREEWVYHQEMYVLRQSSICSLNEFLVSDFTKLFEHLKQLQGSVDIKKEVIRDVINESLRFKRKALAKLLEDFLAGLEKNGSSASVGIKRVANSVYSGTNNHS